MSLQHVITKKAKTNKQNKNKNKDIWNYTQEIFILKLFYFKSVFTS